MNLISQVLFLAWQRNPAGTAEAAQGWKGAGPLIGFIALAALILGLWAHKRANDR